MTETLRAAGERDPRPLRLRLELAYDGAAFNGWAAQPGLRTVEGVLTDALSTVLRAPVRLTVAGRTDAGVHAAAQVAHLDVSREAWARLPGRSDRPPETALLTRLSGVLSREARGLPGTPRGSAAPAPSGSGTPFPRVPARPGTTCEPIHLPPPNGHLVRRSAITF